MKKRYYSPELNISGYKDVLLLSELQDPYHDDIYQEVEV